MNALSNERVAFKKDKSEASDNQSYIYYLCFITVISLYILFLLIYFKFCFSKINLNILNDNKEGSHLTIREFTVEVEGFPKNTTYYDLKEYVEMLQKDLDYKIVKVSTVFKNKNIYNDLNNIGIKIFRINKAAEIYKVKVEKNTKMKKLEAIKKQIIKKKEKTKIKISNFLKKYNLNEKILNLNIIKKNSNNKNFEVDDKELKFFFIKVNNALYHDKIYITFYSTKQKIKFLNDISSVNIIFIYLLIKRKKKFIKNIYSKKKDY